MPPDDDLPTHPGPHAAFIARHPMQPVAAGGIVAIAETERALGGDRRFWADDNASILEFLTLPAGWRRHPREVADAFFLASLCRGPSIRRRRGHPRLEALANDGGSGRAGFDQTFMSIECDLPKRAALWRSAPPSCRAKPTPKARPGRRWRSVGDD